MGVNLVLSSRILNVNWGYGSSHIRVLNNVITMNVHNVEHLTKQDILLIFAQKMITRKLRMEEDQLEIFTEKVQHG